MKNIRNCPACGKEIAANSKVCPLCGAKQKKPIWKRWWVWVCVAIVIIIAVSNKSPSNKTQPIQKESTAYEQNDLPTPMESSVETPIESQQENEIIVLTAGEMGEYGSEMTLNAGTEFEDTFIAYHVPSGTYTVTNKGEYMNQINVYSDETQITEAGWEEPKTGNTKLIDVGKSDTITVDDNQYIEISEPAYFELVMQ